jgi:hypothetical protein
VVPHHHREQCSYIKSSSSSYDLAHVDLHLGQLDSWEVGCRYCLRKNM